MRRIFASLASALCLCLPAAGARYALLVGNSLGGSETEALRYVTNDLKGMRDILTSLGGFESQNVISLYNKSPEDLGAALRQFAGQVSTATDDLFLFYYSGHADEGALHFADRRYPLARVRAALDSMPARIRIAVLDACQSGGVTRIKGGRLEEPFLFKEDSKVKGLVVLYSSSPTENSQESDKFRNSVFTFHFLNALRGCGDLSQDGKITVNEAYQYSYNRTVSSTVQSSSGAQHPGYQFRIQGEGDIVLADLNLREQGVLLGRGIAGSMSIMDSSAGIVADFVKESDAAFVVALNAGTYRLACTRIGQRTQAFARVSAGAIACVRPTDFAPVTAGDAATIKGADRRTRACLALSVGGGAYDFSSLTTDLTTRFQDYTIFGMHPDFSLPRGLVRLGGALEIELPLGVVLGWSADYAWVDQEASWDGSRPGVTAGTAYGRRLDVSQSLGIFDFSTGPGYRLQRGLLAGLSLHVNVNAQIVDYRVTTSFADSLFDVQASGSLHEAGIVLLPVGVAEYVVALGEKVVVGARLRYRYQGDAKRLWMTDETEQAFAYDVGGVDVTICVGVRLRGGSHE